MCCMFIRYFRVLETPEYSRVSNKRAAQIINYLKNSNLHGLITSCMFINIWSFSSLQDFFTIGFWKISACTALLHPARLLILGNFPSCTVITSCTFIRYSRVHTLMKVPRVMWSQTWPVMLMTAQCMHHLSVLLALNKN